MYVCRESRYLTIKLLTGLPTLLFHLPDNVLYISNFKKFWMDVHDTFQAEHDEYKASRLNNKLNFIHNVHHLAIDVPVGFRLRNRQTELRRQPEFESFREPSLSLYPICK